MATEFNYRRAHRELAYPGWLALPDSIKQLYRAVQLECAEIQHSKVMGGPHDLDWPADGALKARFLAEKPKDLLHAQTAIYWLGHWDSEASQDLDFPRDSHGGYWKFQYYALQALSEMGNTELRRRSFDEDAFMDHVEGTDYSDKELSCIFTVAGKPEFSSIWVDHVNHRLREGMYALKGKSDRHPFCIGTKHFQNDSMYLDPSSAPCDICGCDYADHISDRVAILTVPSRKEAKLTEPEQQALIQRIKPLLDQYKLDGVVLRKG